MFAAGNAVVSCNLLSVSAFRVLRVCMVAFISCAAVSVRDIQPERTVRTQYPAQLAENLGQPVNVLLRRVLPPNLHIKPIISKRIVGRACDATVYAFL